MATNPEVDGATAWASQGPSALGMTATLPCSASYLLALSQSARTFRCLELLDTCTAFSK